MVRVLFTTLFFTLFCLSHAQAEDSGFGSYGYGHGELHKSGTIQKLMEKAGKSCCDGGVGGECRMTSIKFTGTGAIAFLDGMTPPPIKLGM